MIRVQHRARVTRVHAPRQVEPVSLRPAGCDGKVTALTALACAGLPANADGSAHVYVAAQTIKHATPVESKGGTHEKCEMKSPTMTGSCAFNAGKTACNPTNHAASCAVVAGDGTCDVDVAGTGCDATQAGAPTFEPAFCTVANGAGACTPNPADCTKATGAGSCALNGANTDCVANQDVAYKAAACVRQAGMGKCTINALKAGCDAEDGAVPGSAATTTCVWGAQVGVTTTCDFVAPAGSCVSSAPATTTCTYTAQVGETTACAYAKADGTVTECDYTPASTNSYMDYDLGAVKTFERIDLANVHGTPITPVELTVTWAETQAALGAASSQACGSCGATTLLEGWAQTYVGPPSKQSKTVNLVGGNEQMDTGVASNGIYLNIRDRQVATMSTCTCTQFTNWNDWALQQPAIDANPPCGNPDPRVCLPLTVCTDDQYESRYPTKVIIDPITREFIYSNDRACADFTDYTQETLQKQCSQGHTARQGATSALRCTALTGCCYTLQGDYCDQCNLVTGAPRSVLRGNTCAKQLASQAGRCDDGAPSGIPGNNIPHSSVCAWCAASLALADSGCHVHVISPAGLRPI